MRGNSLVSTKANRVPGRVRGGDASVMLAARDDEKLTKLTREGLTTEQALDVIADSIAVHVDPITNPREIHANPFRPVTRTKTR